LNNQKKLLYIASYNSSVYRSQVVELLYAIRKLNYFDEIALLSGVYSLNDRRELDNLIRNSGLKSHYFKLIPNYPLLSRVQKLFLKPVIKKMGLDNNTIIHVRSESLIQIISSITKNKYHILTDIRGALYEEARDYHKYSYIKKLIKLYHHSRNLKNVGKHSNQISVVSKELMKYVKARTSIDEKIFSITPCLASSHFIYDENQRRKIRELLGYQKNDVVFVFSTAGNAQWQNTSEIIKSIGSLGYKIINLSNTQITHKNVFNKYSRYEDVAAYLCAADIGIVWRNYNIVNAVSSPVKFSEYVCTGLPILTSGAIPAVNDFVNKYGFGIVLENIQDITMQDVQKMRAFNRKEISTVAHSLFSGEVIAKKYLQLYDHGIKNE
jgi:glycosyltransferase involved in cell wall biosynthesis